MMRGRRRYFDLLTGIGIGFMAGAAPSGYLGIEHGYLLNIVIGLVLMCAAPLFFGPKQGVDLE